MIAVESSNPIFNSLKRLHPPEVELVLAYMLPSDLKKISLDQEPTMSQFIQITSATLRENHPHDVTITKEAPNYRTKQ